MQWSDISFTPTRGTLRQFAGLCCLFLGAAACWQGFKHGNWGLAATLGGLGLILGVSGMLQPQAISWLYVASMIAVFPIGWTVSRLILAVLFYGVFTPVGLSFRLIGRDALQRRRPPDRPTYWLPKPAPLDLGSYLRQF